MLGLFKGIAYIMKKPKVLVFHQKIPLNHCDYRVVNRLKNDKKKYIFFKTNNSFLTFKKKKTIVSANACF